MEEEEERDGIVLVAFAASNSRMSCSRSIILINEAANLTPMQRKHNYIYSIYLTLSLSLSIVYSAVVAPEHVKFLCRRLFSLICQDWAQENCNCICICCLPLTPLTQWWFICLARGRFSPTPLRAFPAPCAVPCQWVVCCACLINVCPVDSLKINPSWKAILIGQCVPELAAC